MSKHSEKTSLGALSSAAWAEFGEVSAAVERALTVAFGAEKYNYLALMMVDPEVHFHVIPRYSRPVSFLGALYEDADWPEATRRIPLAIPDTIKAQIEARLRQVMNS